jgi:transcriptional regulator with XRE-family HTH domain
VDRRREIREFLMSRRARVTPDAAGLYVLDGDVRRVPGLRREEVANLAGVSADYYTQLERGDLDGASDSVLNAVARALRLDDAERLHLFDLARPEAATRLASSSGAIRSSVQRTLDAFTGGMGLVRNRRWDYLAANTLGRAVYAEVFDGPTGPTAPGGFSMTGRPWRTTRPASCAPKPAEIRTIPDRPSSSRSCCRPAPSSGRSGHSTTCGSRQHDGTASTTRSSAISILSSRPRRCGQTPA